MTFRNDFLWGEFESTKELYITEIFDKKLHTYNQTVREGDVVVDIGASVGIFTESIIDKNPKHVYCVEPYPPHYKNLKYNMRNYSNVTCIPIGISSSGGEQIFETAVHGNEASMECITFKQFIQIFEINHIDFLKLDCEGGEYSILSEEFINKMAKYISAEIHLRTPLYKSKFAHFRESVLKHTNNFDIRAHCGTPIKWDLYNQHFIDYYEEVHLYIDNT